MNIHVNTKLKKALVFFLLALFAASPVLKADDGKSGQTTKGKENTQSGSNDSTDKQNKDDKKGDENTESKKDEEKKGIWANYKTWIIVLVLLVFMGIAGYMYMRSKKEEE